jgi:sensor histidine kinase YesM
MDNKPASTPWFKDWTQYLWPGPNRSFTPEEMLRGASQEVPAGLGINATVQGALLLLMLAAATPVKVLPWLVVIVILMTAFGIWGTGVIWREPTQRRLNVILMYLTLAGGLIGGTTRAVLKRTEDVTELQSYIPVLTIWGLGTVFVVTWWLLTMMRVQQIESRLRDLDALEAEQRLQRRLATAQIHPHFVFNTLASLTHWVETQDPRAAPLLRDFNAYLRATLPMFEREHQPLREELDLVCRYLAIMAARLGERLQWSVDADPQFDSLQLPPGSLLTLAENAITHGIEPALRGGRVQVSVKRVGPLAQLQVRDTGNGLNGALQEGLGLSNTRQRLQALHPSATLTLHTNADGGCTATLEIPA